MQELRGKRVTVAGLGRFGGGTAASRWLVEQGCQVLVTDKAPPEKLAESLGQLKGLPIEYRLGEHREEDFTSAELVVASPAIPPGNPLLAAARAAGVPVTTEICLFIERCAAPVIAVTGTKGKSTTTALLGEMVKKQHTTWVGGNIGKSLLPELSNIRPEHWVVLELSSFMLEYLRELRWSPRIGVITMILADHLDWHGSVEAYVNAKRSMLRHQSAEDWAILNEEDPLSAASARETRARVRLFGLMGRRPFELKIPGRHNQLNAQAAFAAAEVVGVSWDEAQAAVQGFAGLPHRLQLVHERDGVRYYNDSIATIPEAAVAALESFPAKSVIQIVGGYDKGLPLTAMCGALAERAKAVLCIGLTGPRIAEALGESHYAGGAVAYQCGDLETAMRMAHQTAAAGDVVLLSPGCASYDQFSNFEQRGEMFIRLARQG
jgi:UDP-N-acetylmuramoylalanine--D-glutamate ligase